MKILQQWLPTLLTFLPLWGVILLSFIPKEKKQVHRWIGILATIPPLALAILMAIQFNSTKGFQWTQSSTWFSIPLGKESWVFNYSMGIDGLSMPFIFLICLVSTIAAIASLSISKRTKEYYVLFLLLQVGTLGTFLSTNFFLFFIFFEITLITMFFLIGIWGYLGRERAANHFLLYNGLGSGFMLFSMIGLFILFHNLDFVQIQQGMQQVVSIQMEDATFKFIIWSLFISLMIAFGIKLPMFPFHSWMLRVHVEAPPSVVIIHSGILLKIGAYGLLRFGVGFFPTYMKDIAVILAIIGVVNILYGAVLAFVEKEFKKVLAYSSVSHMGIVLLGIAALNKVGLEGAVYQAVSHGLISALLFFLVGSLYDRTKTTHLDELGGLAKSVPILSGFLMIAGLALLGLPGTSGFISEFFSFLGLFQIMPSLAAVGSLGLILAAIYTLRAILNITFGTMKERFDTLTDIGYLEVAPMLILVGFIIWIGVYPAILGEPIQHTIQLLVSRMGG